MSASNCMSWSLRVGPPSTSNRSTGAPLARNASTTSAIWWAIESSAARAKGARVTPKVKPVAVADGVGVPPGRAKAPESRDEMDAARVGAVAARSASSWVETPSSSAAQIRVEPALRMLPSIGEHRRVHLPRERQADARRAGVAVADAAAVDEAHDRGARAMRRLDGARGKGPMRKKSGMGVGQHRADGTSIRERRQAARLRKGPVEATTRGRAGERHIENRQQLLVPLCRRRHRRAACARRCRPRPRPRRRSATEERRRSSRCRSRQLSRGPDPAGGGRAASAPWRRRTSDRAAVRSCGGSTRRVRPRAERRRSPPFAGPATRGPASAPRRFDDPR